MIRVDDSTVRDSENTPLIEGRVCSRTGRSDRVDRAFARVSRRASRDARPQRAVERVERISFHLVSPSRAPRVDGRTDRCERIRSVDFNDARSRARREGGSRSIDSIFDFRWFTSLATTTKTTTTTMRMTMTLAVTVRSLPLPLPSRRRRRRLRPVQAVNLG